MQPKSSIVRSHGAPSRRLLGLIESRSARIGIIGQGYVGLPLAMFMAEAGFVVTGYDLSSEKVARLNEGSSYIEDISDGDLRRQLAAGRFCARGDFDDLDSQDVICVCVPTPLTPNKEPDVSYIEAASRSVAASLRSGQLVVLESTTFPGTTRALVLPLLEREGMEVGRDFFLAFSPERVDPGNPTHTIHNTPRLLAGVTTVCGELAAAIYGSFIEQIHVLSSPEAAEMAKLLENTFRAVNIGFANELAIMCRKLGLDVWEVIEAAATKPFGFMKFTPGPGLGGHCIPVDPHYLSWALREVNYTARFVELSAQVNNGMVDYVGGLVAEALNADRKSIKGSRILVLGMAYKRDVGDVRESPALGVVELLLERGAELRYHDPHVRSFRLMDGGELRSVELIDEELQAADCVVITTAHRAVDYERVGALCRCVVDTRNAMAAVLAPKARVLKL